MGIAQNHCFEQGNKRTAFTAAVVFLLSNGYNLVAADSEQLGELVTRLVAGQITDEAFTEIIRRFVTPLC
jgi:death-on-curing protein